MNYLIHRGNRIPFEALEEYCGALDLSRMQSWEADLFDFIRSWYSGCSDFTVRTSGSTGNPKMMTVQREDMLLSATFTLRFLHLEPGMKALLCLTAKFIAGKMMFVRAYAGSMDLFVTEPTSNPFNDLDHPVDFTAITPHQLASTLSDDRSFDKLGQIGRIIIGGASIDPAHLPRLSEIKGQVFSTYGMTESLSHIAMAKISDGKMDHFKLVSDQFKTSIDSRGCLIIHTPFSHAPELITNDIIQPESDGFTWKGRYDNIINSGGIKHFPEEIEKKLGDLMEDPFFIVGKPDPSLGEMVTLIIESEKKDLYQSESFRESLKMRLDRLELPREIILVNQFSYTENGKIDRLGSLKSYQ